jgi:exodeoxyribonuclease VII large subunit
MTIKSSTAPLPAALTYPSAGQSLSFSISSNELLAPARGIPLSQLLAGVSKAVADAYKAGVWTIVEVMELKVSNRHVYLGLSERDAHGNVLAKVNGVIWGSVAASILPTFERATGVQLAPGIKILLRARPVFKSQYGFSLEIDAIDEQFTLGDFELRKKEIRQKLQEEGIFNANRQLPKPWDFNSVLVVAPANGAGLGDFQAEASRLSGLGICHFEYCYSRFQGEGAGADIRASLIEALKAWKVRFGTPPDAIVIIRGGGAANDLAWLNDFQLTRLICRLPIPVLTGIGHERDQTLLDEVASSSFDTPSKVIAGIERVIFHRAKDAQAEFEAITALSVQKMRTVGATIDRLSASVQSEANRHVADAKRLTSGFHAAIALGANQKVNAARVKMESELNTIKNTSAQAVAAVKALVPALLSEISLSAQHGARVARLATDSSLNSVSENAGRITLSARQRSDEALRMVGAGAYTALKLGSAQAEAYMREIAGQGPEKTLKRGFALVMADGKPVSRAAQVLPGASVEIQFSDGALPAHIDQPNQ